MDTAIILAAGKGTRLMPLTSTSPKPLLKIAGKSIIDRLIEQLITANITEIKVVVGYKGDLIENHLREHHANVQVIQQTEQLGTADAVKVALDSVDSDFIVVNGDVLFDAGEIVATIKHYHEKKIEGIAGVFLGYNVEEPSKFGLFHTKNGLLENVIEKPDPSSIQPPYLINAGFYIFPSTAKEHFFSIDKSERGEYEIPDVIMKLLETQKIAVRQIEGEWFDVGYPWNILEANLHFLQQEADLFVKQGTIESGTHFHGAVHVGKGARIRSGVYIEGPVFIDENADIGPNCYIRPGTYLGKNTRVGNGCEIKNSIFYDGTHAGHLAYVGDSILGYKCNLGAGTKTANLRHDNTAIKVTVKNSRISSNRRKLGVIMGDSVKTGINVSILPGVVISENSKINAGIVVNRDL